MSCSCQFAYEDCHERADAWREGRVQRSRKPHRCSECGDRIPAGSRYCYAVAISSDGCQQFYRCVACAGLAELLAMKHEVCALWGGLADFCENVDFDWYAWRERMKAQFEADREGR